MKTLKTIIIDDERLAREELKFLLKDYHEIEIIDEAKNGTEGIQKIKSLKPDLIFLDISMPEMNGFEMLKQLDEIPKVIFVTAFDEFAINAFEVNALDYVLKPVDPTRLDESIQKLGNKEDEFSKIDGSILETNTYLSDEKTSKIGRQNRNLFQVDYVLPIKESMQLELGYRGSYTNSGSDYEVVERVNENDPYTNVAEFTNNFEYIENVSAFYTQFGTKFFKKLSVLAGLRFENTNLEINQLLTNDLNKRNYNNLFPSLFFTYELNDDTNLSLNYSKRISRPRDRFINPFSSITSNTNLFIGNPKLNPALTDAFDIGYLHKWDKITLSTSAYYNHTKDAFQTVRKESGKLENGIPVIINTPFNLGEDNRIGMEVTLNYSLKKWWKLNSNVNYFYNETKGNYQFTDTNNNLVTQDFNYKSSTWSARLTSKINLPYKIDWQTNANYNAGQKTAQGKTKGIAAMNLAFSKDVLKDKATIAFNVNDVFNSRKRIQDLQLPTVNSYSEMQWRVRSVTVSFTYRFNKLKTDKDPKPKVQEQENGGEF